MLNSYIQNQGMNQTIIYAPKGPPQVNQTHWDALYNGDVAQVDVNTNTNGKRDHYQVTLNNDDLAEMLSMPSVHAPIDQRLRMDFQEPVFSYEPSLMMELSAPKLSPRAPTTVNELIRRSISSPASKDELIVPLALDHKRRNRRKSHITHRVYKKRKSSSRLGKKSRTSKKSNRTAKSSASMPIVDFLNSM